MSTIHTLIIILESLALFILGYGLINPTWRREEEMDDKWIFCPFRFLQYFQSEKKDVQAQKQVTLDSLPAERLTE